jgi:uncharacterized protein (TIGR02444 family)
MSGVWDWALAVYAKAGVPEACLALQDAHGQNTSLLLWAVYSRQDDPSVLAQGAALATAWDSAALHPLRAARRALKPSLPPVDDTRRSGLRADIQGLELAAERLLLETLEALAPSGVASAPEALAAAVGAWDKPASPEALAALADALNGSGHD